jgi:hypothetical protein
LLYYLIIIIIIGGFRLEDEIKTRYDDVDWMKLAMDRVYCVDSNTEMSFG